MFMICFAWIRRVEKVINNKSILAIIPARGGSKGIPRKNIKPLNGKPLIGYTIEEALKSKYIDRIIVSTEDSEIAELSRRCGAEVPFLRPKELAEDSTPGMDPILHCIDWLEVNDNYQPAYIVCLQCTSPFRKSYQVDDAIEILVNNNGDSIVSVCESEVSPYWMKKIKDGKICSFLDNIDFIPRRQELPIVYRLNGGIYIAKTDLLKEQKSWYTKDTIPYIMDKISSVDIDDILDFKFAEFLIKENLK